MDTIRGDDLDDHGPGRQEKEKNLSISINYFQYVSISNVLNPFKYNISYCIYVHIKLNVEMKKYNK